MAKKNYNKKGTFVVEMVGIFPIKDSIKNMTVKKGQYKGQQFNIEKTHTVAVKIPELHEKWITIGHRKFKEGDELVWRADCGGDWKSIYDGSELEFRYAVNDAGYIDINLSTIWLEKAGPEPAQEDKFFFGQDKKPAASGNTGAGKFDSLGAIKGNAFKCALQILKGKIDSPKMVETIKACKELNEKLQDEFSGLHGAVVGMCVQEACIHCTTLKKAEDWAREALEVTMGVVDDVFDGKSDDKGGDEEEEVVEPDVEVDEDDIPF